VCFRVYLQKSRRRYSFLRVNSPIISPGFPLSGKCASHYTATYSVKGIRNRYLDFMNPEPNFTSIKNFWVVFWMSWFLTWPESRPSWQLLHGFLSPSRHMSVYYPQTGHDRILPHSFIFIIYWLFYHSTLYDLICWRN